MEGSLERYASKYFAKHLSEECIQSKVLENALSLKFMKIHDNSTCTLYPKENRTSDGTAVPNMDGN
ncbi:hypothetical protein KUTeg_021248 [Tegillarca granosa]|uniref:Uncharacterized protein n=1 Tax=Tegillarca granosa TaxID=220873 RepID=A0ABQ9EEI9_TEGGR|nr:hypothetical protein KUTeg_021248 [Tegillarca granosa]